MLPSVIGDWLRRWNRKLHIYVGLYFVLFTALFAISGLALNRSTWAVFAGGAAKSELEREIDSPSGETQLARARDLMSQLGVSGEIHQIEVPKDVDGLNVWVLRPNRLVIIRARLGERIASVEIQRRAAWDAIRGLHEFTGQSRFDPSVRRDWWLTTVWAIAIDALSLGAIFLVASGIWMWLQLRQKRIGGSIALAGGCLVLFVFLVALKWL